LTPQPSLKRLLSLPKRKAEFIEPMECAPISKLADRSQWVYEIKLDGNLAIAVKAETMAAITFVDRVVFHVAVENRILFHELVHVIQYQKTRTG
jgi:hypothetical protein